MGSHLERKAQSGISLLELNTRDKKVFTENEIHQLGVLIRTMSKKNCALHTYQ